MTHAFDEAWAVEYGLHEALILQSFRHWIRLNRANGRHEHDGRWWSYQSQQALNDTWPYLKPGEIRAAIERLVECGVLLKAHLGGFNRTCWYAFQDEERFLGAMTNDGAARRERQENLWQKAAEDKRAGHLHGGPNPFARGTKSICTGDQIHLQPRANESKEHDSDSPADALTDKSGGGDDSVHGSSRGENCVAKPAAAAASLDCSPGAEAAATAARSLGGNEEDAAAFRHEFAALDPAFIAAWAKETARRPGIMKPIGYLRNRLRSRDWPTAPPTVRAAEPSPLPPVKPATRPKTPEDEAWQARLDLQYALIEQNKQRMILEARAEKAGSQTQRTAGV